MASSMKKLPTAIRSAVWNKYIGEEYGVSTCFTGCGSRIAQNNFQIGHVVSKHRNGTNHIENLRPICQRCNTSMGSTDMYEFMSEYGLKSPHEPGPNFSSAPSNPMSTSPTMRELFPALYAMLKS